MTNLEFDVLCDYGTIAVVKKEKCNFTKRISKEMLHNLFLAPIFQKQKLAIFHWNPKQEMVGTIHNWDVIALYDIYWNEIPRDQW